MKLKYNEIINQMVLIYRLFVMIMRECVLKLSYEKFYYCCLGDIYYFIQNSLLLKKMSFEFKADES